LLVGADDFYLNSVDIGEWLENQILIPDWTYFHCPGTTLVPRKGGARTTDQYGAKIFDLWNQNF